VIPEVPAMERSPAGIFCKSVSNEQAQITKLYHFSSNGAGPVIFSRIVLFMIQGVWGQYATVELNGNREPFCRTVSPRILSRRVLLPLPTGPTIAVIVAFLKVISKSRRVGSESFNQEKLASRSSSTIPTGGVNKPVLDCSSIPSAPGTKSESSSSGAWVQYFSMRSKHPTDCHNPGSAWTNLRSGNVIKEIRDREVNVRFEKSESPPVVTAIKENITNVAYGASVRGKFAAIILLAVINWLPIERVGPTDCNLP
jgi:hypothetical protein